MFALLGLMLTALYLGIALFYIICYWIVFTKAGRPGWGVLIPIYNLYLIVKIAGRPGWWTVLGFIPLVNIVIWIIVALDIAKAFGKGTGFGIVLILFPFIAVPILAFGSAKYTAPSALPPVAAATPAPA